MNIQHPLLGNLKVISGLGNGSYSNVFLAQSEKYGFPMALKQILDKKYDVQKEITSTARATHPYVVEFYDAFSYQGNVYIITEYVEGVTLLEFVNERGGLEESEARRIMTQMIAVLVHLHDTINMVHRDLKCENIMIDSNYNIKLIDFGFAREIDEHMLTSCGSPNYIAPEVVTGSGYDKAVDIWSLGVILYAMVVGTLPFMGNSVPNIIHKVINSSPYYPANLSDSLVNLLKRMMNKDPAKRITLDELMKHEWITTNMFGNEYRFDLTQLSRISASKQEISDQLAFFKLDYEKASNGSRSEESVMKRVIHKSIINQKINKMGVELLTPIPKVVCIKAKSSLPTLVSPLMLEFKGKEKRRVSNVNTRLILTKNNANASSVKPNRLLRRIDEPTEIKDYGDVYTTARNSYPGEESVIYE